MLGEVGEREAKAKMACEENVSLESDAEELLRSKEWRQKNRNLLGSPLIRHMKAVEGTATASTLMMTMRMAWMITAETRVMKQT